MRQVKNAPLDGDGVAQIYHCPRMQRIWHTGVVKRTPVCSAIDMGRYGRAWGSMEGRAKPANSSGSLPSRHKVEEKIKKAKSQLVVTDKNMPPGCGWFANMASAGNIQAATCKVTAWILQCLFFCKPPQDAAGFLSVATVISQSRQRSPRLCC